MTREVIWPRVIGQQRVKQMLLSALRGKRLPHAYLFYGNEGVGKDAMALELARVIQCEKEEEEACGTCASCRKLDSLQHPDVHFVTALPRGRTEKGDDAPLANLTEHDVKVIQGEYRLKGANPYYRMSIPRANDIRVNSIREIRRDSSMSSFARGKKVFIISAADEMNDEASNTLLKTLEEPSGSTMLILTTARRENLLQTIVSRCQLVRFDPLREEDIRGALTEREGVETQQAALVARLANGSYTRALELLQEDVATLRQDVVTFVRHAVGNNIVALSQKVDELASYRDREVIRRFLAMMLVWFRDSFVLAHGGTIINLDQQQDLKRFVDRFGSADLSAAISAVERAISVVDKNAYIPLVLLQLSVRLRSIILHAAAA